MLQATTERLNKGRRNVKQMWIHLKLIGFGFGLIVLLILTATPVYVYYFVPITSPVSTVLRVNAAAFYYNVKLKLGKACRAFALLNPTVLP